MKGLRESARDRGDGKDKANGSAGSCLNINQLPHTLLIHILLNVHGGLFPSGSFRSCFLTCRLWGKLMPRTLRSVHFEGTDDATTTKMVRHLVLASPYNETLRSVSVSSLATSDTLATILLALTTPFFSQRANTLYHPPVTRLEITSTPLSDRTIQLICDIIRLFNLEQLMLCSVGLTDAHLITLSKALATNHFNQLTSVNLSHNNYTRVGLEFMLNSLLQTQHNNNTCKRPQLQQQQPLSVSQPLHSSFNSMSLSNSSMSSLSTMSSSTNTTASENAINTMDKSIVKNYLTSLELSNNAKLGFESIAPLLARLEKLSEIRIANVQLSSDGLLAFIELLKSSRTLNIIDLSNNFINPRGVETIASLLYLNHISSLDLSENKVGLSGVKALAEVVSTGLAHMKHFYMRRTNLAFDECMVLRNLLLRTTTIETLDLSSNLIDSDAVALLCEALQHNRSVRDLNLSFNILGASGVTAIAKALAANNHLRTLRLHCVSMKKAGAMPLAEMLATNNSLTELYLSNNEIKSTGAIDLAKAIRSNRSLLFCDLSFNGINDKGATALFKVASDFNYTIRLDLSGNPITVKCQQNSKNDCNLM